MKVTIESFNSDNSKGYILLLTFKYSQQHVVLLVSCNTLSRLGTGYKPQQAHQFHFLFLYENYTRIIMGRGDGE